MKQQTQATTKSQKKKFVKWLKGNKKTPGFDSITIEAIKASGEKMVDLL